METKKDILKVVDEISTIPTLPTVLQKITSLLQNPQTSAEEIGRAITNDQSLASKVLKLVNSAFYGFPGRISTITHAVVILGFSTIKNIVLTASIFESFKKGKDTGTNLFDMEKFWMHSIACGAASLSIARQTGYKEKEECFIAGLLHDVGKILLCQYMPEEFNKVIVGVKENDKLFIDIEKEELNATHQEIGGLLVEKWNLPKNLQSAVKYHHNPMKSQEHFEMTSIVHVADILIRALDMGNGGDNKMPMMTNDAWEALKLEEFDIQNLLGVINEEVDKATVFMQV